MSINKVTLLGNVCGDPKVYSFEDGNRVCNFDLATTEKGYTTKEGHTILDSTEFHHIVLKRPGLIGVAEKYLKKGSKLYCEGKIKSRTLGMEDGDIKTRYEIIVDSIELL